MKVTFDSVEVNSDPQAMKAIISEYMHMRGDDYR